MADLGELNAAAIEREQRVGPTDRPVVDQHLGDRRRAGAFKKVSAEVGDAVAANLVEGDSAATHHAAGHAAGSAAVKREEPHLREFDFIDNAPSLCARGGSRRTSCAAGRGL